MNSGFRSQCVPKYGILTEDQIKEIHLATLEILSTVGVRVMHKEAIQMLTGAGCHLKSDDVVVIPDWLVEESILSCPSQVVIYSRNGDQAMRLGGREINFGLGTDLMNTYDLYTGELRTSRLEDVANAARVADYCRDVDFLASYALPQDVPTNLMYIQSFRTVMENSTKPVFFTAAGREDLSYIIDIASVAAGGRDRLREKPFLIHYSEPTPPLTHSYGAVGKLLLCAEKGVPLMYAPAMMLGASGPVTLAGGIVQANAEALSGIVLHQLKAKGAPVISGFAVTPMDMRTTIASYAAPEQRLTNSVCADLYHYYGIPMWSTVGTDAHSLDQQAAMEHGMLTLVAALDGANLIHDVGYMGQGLTGNPAAIVMCNEIIGFVKRMVRGFDISRESMALDVISRVGPGGNYLAEEHTLKMFRQEIWQPALLNRDDADVWTANGRKTYGDIVRQKAIEILESHKPQPLPEATVKTVDSIVDRAATALSGLHFEA